MTKEQVENIQDALRDRQSGAEDGDKRERSTMQFPYNDLDDAVAIGSHGFFFQLHHPDRERFERDGWPEQAVAEAA